MKRWNLATIDHKMVMNLMTFFYIIVQFFSFICICIHCRAGASTFAVVRPKNWSGLQLTDVL